MVNPSAFSVREILNQNQLHRFRTSQILVSGNTNTSGILANYGFHASNFVNVANIRQLIFVGNGVQPTNYNVEFFMTSSLASNERQYWYSNINLRAIDLPNNPIPFFDGDGQNCLHGKITQNTSGGSFFMDYIEIRYNRMLEMSG